MAINKFLGLVKELGFFCAVLYVSDLFLQRLSPNCSLKYYYFYKQKLSCQASGSRDRKSAFAYKYFLHVDSSLLSLPRPKGIVESRFEQNATCYAAFLGKELNGCIWFAKQQYVEDEVRCVYKVPVSDLWDFDVYVAEKYRVGLLFDQLWRRASCLLLQGGSQYSYSRISAFNRNSCSSHEKLGAKKIGRGIFLTVFSFQIMVCSFKPWLHIALPGANSPTIYFE